MSEARTQEQVVEASDEVWSRDEEFFHYESLGELLDTHDDLEVGQMVYVGHKVQPDVSSFFDADDLLDRIAEAAYDNHGECAEDWPGKVSDEAKEEFNAMVAAWVTNHCPTNFFAVEDVREHVITAEDKT